MKKKIIMLIIIFTTLACSNAPAEEWRNFQGDARHSFDYPSDWKAAKGTAETLFDNIKSPDDNAGITIVVGPVQQEKLLNEDGTGDIPGFKIDLDQLMEEVIEERSQGGSIVNILSKEKIKLGERDAALVELEITPWAAPDRQPPPKYYYKIYSFIEGPFTYSLYFSAKNKEAYERYLPTAQKIIASFKPPSEADINNSEISIVSP